MTGSGAWESVPPGKKLPEEQQPLESPGREEDQPQQERRDQLQQVVEQPQPQLHQWRWEQEVEQVQLPHWGWEQAQTPGGEQPLLLQRAEQLLPDWRLEALFWAPGAA